MTDMVTVWLPANDWSGVSARRKPGAARKPLTNVDWCRREALRMRGVEVLLRDDGFVALVKKDEGK